MNVYIGIDPSINSTGICIQKYNDKNKLYKEHFFIIKPNKLAKNEEKIDIKNFQFYIYNKFDISNYDDFHDQEYYKSINIFEIAKTVQNIISKHTSRNDNIFVAMEGISYGSSLRTKSIFDLAGLNYLLRYILTQNKKLKIYICPPAEIKKFASGKGNSDKDILCEAFLIIYPKFKEIKKIDDIADAYYMCKYVVNKCLE